MRATHKHDAFVCCRPQLLSGSTRTIAAAANALAPNFVPQKRRVGLSGLQRPTDKTHWRARELLSLVRQPSPLCVLRANERLRTPDWPPSCNRLKWATTKNGAPARLTHILMVAQLGRRRRTRGTRRRHTCSLASFQATSEGRLRPSSLASSLAARQTGEQASKRAGVSNSVCAKRQATTIRLPLVCLTSSQLI